MDILVYSMRRFVYAIPLIFGVTLISFVLMVFFAPDKTHDLVGRNPTPERIQQVRHQLGYDRPFMVRYGEFLKQLFTFDFGHSDSTGERVTSIFAKTIPVSMAIAVPGLILGVLLGIVIALIAAYYRGKWPDKLIMGLSVIGMSISYLVIVIVFQVVFCSSYGLGLYPVQGWRVDSFTDYIRYATVPVMTVVFVSLGYNTRFYRAVLVEEMTRDHVRTARAFGCHPVKLLLKHILKNAMIPISTRIMISLPYIIIGGNLILETFYNIPGFGYIAFQAMTTGDQPVIKAVVSSVAVVYVIFLVLTDIVYKIVDPRIQLK